MTRIFIIEDEAPARERLAALVGHLVPPCVVAGSADSVASADAWLRAHPAPDLILADIQLGDGLSLELFRAQPPPCPVIFTTAHDAYLLEAFATHGIAYVLKPVKPAALESAVQKYRELGRHFTRGLTEVAAALTRAEPRRRILAQRGTSYQPVAIADVAYFFSENKLTFLVTRTGEKCLVNETLTALTSELEASQFFRLNRNYLAAATSLKSFTPIGKGRLAVTLAPAAPEEVQVSQENAAEFRAWVGR